MSITSFSRMKGYPKSQRKLEKIGQLPVVRTYHTDKYEIQVNSEGDIANIILDNLPIQPGDEIAPGEGVASVSLDRSTDSRFLWYAEYQYQPMTAEDIEAAQSGAAPDALTPIWSWGFETLNLMLPVDAKGKKVETTAHEEIGLEASIAIPVLTVERYEPSFDPSTIIDYVNHVNDSEFYGADAGTALMAGITDQKDSHAVFDGIYYRKVSYTIKFALPYIEEFLEGWKAIMIDRGTFYLDTSGNQVHFKAGGSDVAGNLNGTNGQKSSDGSAFLLTFDRFPDADFSALNLGPF